MQPIAKFEVGQRQSGAPVSRLGAKKHSAILKPNTYIEERKSIWQLSLSLNSHLTCAHLQIQHMAGKGTGPTLDNKMAKLQDRMCTSDPCITTFGSHPECSKLCYL